MEEADVEVAFRPEKEQKPPQTTPESNDKILRIVQQAEEMFEKNGSLWDTYFYKVVLSGNVKLIEDVVKHMEAHNHNELADWLFKRNRFLDVRHEKMKRSQRLMVTRVLLFICLTILTVLLTPVFYAVHLFTVSLYTCKERRISANINLPLAYAAFSQKQQMIAFFLSQDVEVESVDKRGNNVFHYIADLSSVAPEKATKTFTCTVEMIDDTEIVKKLLEEDYNSRGLTAVEYTAKFGSPVLLNHILQQPHVMRHTEFAASEQDVQFAELSGESISNSRTLVDMVDVTMYEDGSFINQSSLLNILSDRNIAAMTVADLHIFSKYQLVGKWMRLKCKQMLAAVMFFHVCDFLITCVLLYILSVSFLGSHSVTFKQWFTRLDKEVQITEVEAWSRNTSNALTPDRFHGHILPNAESHAVKNLPHRYVL